MSVVLYKKALIILSVAWAAEVSMPAFALPTYTITDLGTLDGKRSDARGMNNRGDVVGSSGESAFLYSGGVMRDLGRLPTGGIAMAYDVNDARQVTGYNYNFEPGGTRAFL